MNKEHRVVQIIVCYNDANQITELNRTVVFDEGSIRLTYLDNRNRSFPSAAAAYNYALKSSDKSVDVIIFCHQDIRFSDKSIWLISEACLNEKNTLFGVAGVRNEGNKNWGKTISTLNGTRTNWPPDEEEKYTTVFTLDECLIAGHRSVFEKVTFDEKICDGWHLYATDLCLQCHLAGIEVKVLDAQVQHLSPGHVDKAFIKTEGKLAKKYQKNFEIISHTNGWTYTNPVKRGLLLGYRWLKYRWWKM